MSILVNRYFYSMKYFLAYSIPIVAIIGITLGGFWSFLVVIYAFFIIPLLEIMLPEDTTNYTEDIRLEKISNKVYSWLLYGNIPLVYGCLFYVLSLSVTDDISWTALMGNCLSLGIVLGANGINVAHELGHRNSKQETFMAKLLLLPSHYTHFYIEHNHGHHLHVSTPEDPSTAKLNQSLYSFWLQSVFGTYIKAWKIQKNLNIVNNISFLSYKNAMLWFTVLQIFYLIFIFFFFGSKGLFISLFSGIVGFLLLETINYIEHYGLKRKKLPSGRYERVSEIHSWNSNHILGRIILYELTRHSDHHFKANKPYQILEYHQESPQLPFGYPTSMVLSFIPPIWFYIMNKRIPNDMKY